MNLPIGTPIRDRRRRGDEGKIVGFGGAHSQLVRVEWKDGTRSWVVEWRVEKL